ncbi:MAG: M1 family aminopeptidase [Liquorilactobacillus nagelii]|jgi:aminopeptidase N|uniref:Aminopeptidase n=1 Tax=Liquorilactobacillus nagelii TaxID=82688 RepID=A0A3Q8CG75_9LACO|nr:M1 family aminopeptidase [Liquorilactobacillus nagelii]AUJ32932.1 peptidase [Liquorilactobacillus nagelii]KRL41667.1 membrane alanine aminopeptidase [Liquorilactobacillus nagelii DSM 13675]MCC7616316.1 peptidase [Liquorilactobacillus nagelii]MCI1700803.1 M1 family metallopeptidase [Liquorilactobacillus nagelii]MCP9315077.1 M1 family metallopeptidase [Liquorilactobacillus nagelii]
MTEITRFYDTFQPEHYDVFLDINRQEKTITGKTTITGTAEQSEIAVHQKNLKVMAVTVAAEQLEFTLDAAADALKIKLPHAGKVEFSIAYTAPLTDTMMGIYPSYYEVNGEKKQLIGTQFETNFARQAFPCIDEPEAKATFSLAIKFDEQPGELVLSNMPETKVEAGVHYFAPTVKMSTYLVAFAFGDLQSKITTTNSGVKVGVFATKAHQPHELDFALDIAKRAIEFYEDFYQTPYPLPHSWQLALPDFSAGAMENWGLVTYREAYLLLDPANTALDTQKLVATVITHELAHQWFGDLVTMKWWDDLWLNESFANMMEYVAVDAIKPEWHVWEMFQESDVPAALQRDATDGVQSVHVQVNNPAEIDALFDGAIVYAKGARMLVMVRALIGDQALRAGLKQYFAAHQYSNATGADLWSALGSAAGIDVGAVMQSWLEQPGYPVVTAAIKAGELTLEQEQFFIGEGKQQGRSWQIPLHGNYSVVPTLMTDRELVLGDYRQLRQTAGKPFRLNVGNNSHFIVKYDAALLQDILANFESLDAIDQLQLLQDLRLLADSRQVSYAELVPLLPKFAASKSAVVNAILYQTAANLKKFVEPDTAEEKQLKHFFDQLSVKAVERLGWEAVEKESDDDKLTRPYVLNAALYAENAQAIAEAHRLFAAHQADLISLPAAIRPLVLANEVKHFGSQELFDKLLSAYRQTPDASYKSDLCVALTGTPDAALIKQLIEKFEDAETIKPQDLRAWYYRTLANDDGQQAAWDWIRQEWSWLEEKVGGDMEFATYITVTSQVFRSADRLAEFRTFFEPKINTPGLTREIKMDIKVITSRVNLVEAESSAVNAAIAEATK